LGLQRFPGLALCNAHCCAGPASAVNNFRLQIVGLLC
jgi:hypothetical protein